MCSTGKSFSGQNQQGCRAPWSLKPPSVLCGSHMGATHGGKWPVVFCSVGNHPRHHGQGTELDRSSPKYNSLLQISPLLPALSCPCCWCGCVFCAYTNPGAIPREPINAIPLFDAPDFPGFLSKHNLLVLFNYHKAAALYHHKYIYLPTFCSMVINYQQMI